MKMKLELVLESHGNDGELKKLLLEMRCNRLDRFNIEGHWEDKPGLENTWSNEIYLIKKEDASVVGYFKLNKDYPTQTMNIAFYVKEDARNEGVLSAVAPLIADRVFNQLNFRRITAAAMSTNKIAIDIYSKWMRAEGVRKGIYIYDGKEIDNHLFAVLRNESDFTL